MGEPVHRRRVGWYHWEVLLLGEVVGCPQQFVGDSHCSSLLEKEIFEGRSHLLSHCICGMYQENRPKKTDNVLVMDQYTIRHVHTYQN